MSRVNPQHLSQPCTVKGSQGITQSSKPGMQVAVVDDRPQSMTTGPQVDGCGPPFCSDGDGTDGDDPPRMLNLKDLCRLSRLSRSTIYREIKLGKLPPGLRISRRRVVWPLTVVLRWLSGLKWANLPI
jgi:predicted DNA-binding transcriptional regulator AlpA